MSLHRTPPKRLKDTHAGLQELSERSFSQERLDANQARLEATIQSGATITGLTSKAVVTGLGTLAVLTAAALWLTMGPSPLEQVPSQPKPSRSLNPEPLPAIPETEETPDANQPRMVALEMETPEAAKGKTSLSRQNPTEQEGKFKSLQKAPLRISPSKLQKKNSATTQAPKAELGEEIESFQKAKSYFEKQNYDKARQTLEKLEDNFENPKLKLEISLLMVQIRFAAEDADAALSLMQKLMRDPNAKPQAQWYKLLGDIQKSRSQCGRALIAYSKAMKMGLSGEQKIQVSQSVRACSADQ